ncbi:hypothetical protein L1D34_07115 [Vibrio mediterranei]|uniref:hypothetical protein n=1 Tax=Vibrio mediterranei TaxID=689 RepID=UPI001EFD9CC4|nr:hypothetical protein [Vibrio mediterranei]MCG9624608.1 hypothetical protein [Vibrio mediterranei]
MTKRQLAWSYIQQFGHQEFTGVQVMQAVELNNQRTRNLLTSLCDLGKIEVTDQRDTMLTTRYKLVSNSSVENPNRLARKKRTRRPKVKQRLWNSCRVLKVFSLHDLCSTASAALTTGTNFLRPLIKAKIVRKCEAPNGLVYRLNGTFRVECPEVIEDGVMIKERFYPFREEQQ